MTPTEPTVSPTLDEKVAFLERPESYPHEVDGVESIESHMSWVFLAGDRAYKLKKPVRYEFLDFSTAEKRREDCRAEVGLNRRLAPDVYLGVSALTLRDGGFELDGDGRPVDWLTRMERLPRERMLDRMIERGEVDENRLRTAARRLARFYRDAPPASIGPEEYVQRLQALVEENRRELTRPEFEMPRPRAEQVGRRLTRFLVVDREEEFRARVRDGRIVEGHGDLRPEHVCLRDDPVFIDCIEFNRDFRIVDPADELAFLDMECQRLGAPEVASPFFDEYRSATGDDLPSELVDFYRSHRAYLRAKLSIWHVRDDGVSDLEPWRTRATKYLDLAAAQMPL